MYFNNEKSKKKSFNNLIYFYNKKTNFQHKFKCVCGCQWGPLVFSVDRLF